MTSYSGSTNRPDEKSRRYQEAKELGAPSRELICVICASSITSANWETLARSTIRANCVLGLFATLAKFPKNEFRDTGFAAGQTKGYILRSLLK
ncbi:hypothetical protein CCR75_002101 [Bremia lactucae]|uniref:Uncharacterized protein n=1 Tax=Bremia lactucae TaxID=4779 RepID=A0A976FN40_BRELC|nr:hypothetical protein CCR75_002101 [Bremia lactucae]